MVFAIGLIATLLAVAMLGLNTSYIPTPQDESLRVEADGTTKTASFNGTSKSLGVGFAPGGTGQPSCIVIDVTALNGGGDRTYTAVLQESADDATYTDAGVVVPITAVGVISVPGFISKRYVRAKLTLAGTTPSITYGAWFNPLV